MFFEKTIRRAASMMMAVLLTGGAMSTLTSATMLNAGTTEDTAPTEAASVSAEEMEKTAESDRSGWYKAELSEYDDSMSLISYETSPESGEVTDKSLKKKSAGPTPVELNVTGGYVGDIPFLESEPVIESIPGKFGVVTYGWGHGVGLSQNGANFYASYSNWTYQDILFHYYPGTYLMDTGEGEEERITIDGVEGDVVSQISRIVFNEVGGSMHYEAIKAQAVAVYTYCKYHGNDSADLRGKPNPPSIVIDAVKEVLGQALYYNDSFALTMFSASSGGITANCYEVFWADLPYLRSVSSDYDAAYDPHYGTVTYIDDFQLRNLIQGAYGIRLSDDPTKWIQPTYSEQTGYVTYVNIDDQKTVKGYEFKMDIGLKSSKFNIYYTPRPEGEEIPDMASPTEVVDPESGGIPVFSYPNYNEDGNYYIPPELEEPTEEETEEPTEEETTEEPTEAPAVPDYNDPSFWEGMPVQPEDPTEPPTEYTEPEQYYNEEQYNDWQSDWTDGSYDYGYGY